VRSRPADLISVIESAYRVEVDTRTWLRAALEVLAPVLDHGLGVSGFTYDASDPCHFRILDFEGASSKEPLVRHAIEASSPARVRWTFRTTPCQTASAGPDWHSTPAYQTFKKLGFEDVLFLNGLDASGLGCFFTARLRKTSWLTAAKRRLLTRLAVHLGTGLRLHRRLESEARAVLTPSGALVHAEGEAKDASARERLRRAVVAVERARGGMRRTGLVDAVEQWKGLVSARWTLVDRFESDGRRYVVAKDNAPNAVSIEQLSVRERQVLAYARMGHTNKLIAYELGLAPSTVRVLIARAAHKLGARSRQAAIDMYEKLEDATPARP